MKFYALLAGASLATAGVVRRAQPIRRSLPVASPVDFGEMHRAALLASAAYSGCQGTAFGTTIDLAIDDVWTDTIGFVGHDDVLERISIVMRGSLTPQNVLSDIDITANSAPVLSGINFPEGVQLMNGVYDAWAPVHDNVMQTVRTLQQQHPNYTLEATGHSLGGSLTYLAHVALVQNFPNSTVVSNALAAFPMGNQVWAEWAMTQGKLRRGDNQGDGVPNMWTDLYEHYGTEYYGPGVANQTLVCNGERDTNCSAGDGWFTVDLQHTQNSGVQLAFAGCG